MIIMFDNQNQARNGLMSDWLEVASENAQSAVLLSGTPSLKKQALVFVQQSAETATKAVAIRIGMPHENVVKFRHDNLKLSGKIIKKMMDEIHLKSVLGSIMPGDMANQSLRALDTILMGTRDSEFRSSMQLTPPSDVKRVLDLIDSMSLILERDAPPGVERSVKEILASFNVSELYNSNSEFVIPPGVANWLKDQGTDPDAIRDLLARNLIRRPTPLGNDHRGEVSDLDDMRHVPLEVVIEKIKVILKVVVASIKLFLIGGLVWPHYISARYPEPPDSTRLGAQQYNDEIGVIRYIQELSQAILEVVGDLNNYYQKRL